jgi:formate hydrogenlyase transcriptional activator
MMADSADQLRELIDAIPTIAWCGLPDGSVRFVNRRWALYTGLSLDVAGGQWTAAIHPDDLPALIDRWKIIQGTGECLSIEARIRRHDGEYRWFLFHTQSVRDSAGQIARWYGSATDIEERRRSEAQLKTIIDAIPQMIVVLSPAGRALDANQMMLDYTGLTLAEVRSDDFRARVFHPEDVQRLREVREASLRGTTPFEFEQRARRKDGQFRWFLIQYNPLRDETGTVLRWYATATDIDARKRAEDSVRSENQALREEIDRSSMFEEIVGSSAPLQEVISQITRVAPTDSTVLIAGETGTGKELIARAIHKRSQRSAAAFIRVNCAAIPQSLIASELFGHEKGAFTGAMQRRIGRFESADGGTIFLDEVGELPIETQVLLLRVLQEREFERVGSSQTIRVNVRVLAATNRDLPAAVAEGRFRQDLFYRLNVFPIAIPSLRQRRDDIPLLVEYLIERYAKQVGKRFRSVSRRSLDLLQAYDWPGNVRELQNVIERAVILTDGDSLSVNETWLHHDKPAPPDPAPSLNTHIVDHERQMIETALAETGGKISGPTGAALRLGLPRQTLESRIRSLRIDKLRFKRQQADEASGWNRPTK